MATNTPDLFVFNRYNDQCLTPIRPNTTLISNVYEGIPETILFNVISWTVLILLFAILRNRAWDYGRLALVHTEKWTQLFYKNTDDAVAANEDTPVVHSNTSDVSLILDTGCQWFPSIFTITKDRIYSRCGPDAAHYLSFQQHLFTLSTAIAIISLCIILPINFQGNLQGGATAFGHTTISNIDPNSKWLWVHILAALSYVPLTILIMRRCSGRVPSATDLTSQTVMITHISHIHRNDDDIRNYLSCCYPDIEIRDVRVAYRVKKLIELDHQLECVHEAKLYCIQNHKPDLQVQPYGCIACCPWRTQKALDYYSAETDRLIQLVIEERARALQNPLGIAFVTLTSEENVQHMVNTFKPGSLRKWLLSRAPSPLDINWENLQISYRHWYSKAIIINLLLFIVLFFLTTPVIIVNIFNNLAVLPHNNTNHTHTPPPTPSKLSPFIGDFLPTLVLLSLAALLPVLVVYSDTWMSHWTKSKQNHNTMYKTFFFLLFMVLILPSLGLTSAQAFVEWSLQTNSKNATLRWECVFLADKGAFFVNYLITSALIGTALELLRFPELAMYAFRLLRIKSEAEQPSIRKEILSEFPFGIHYAWSLLTFTICTVYSLTCPLITPFNLLYLLLKHFVDKYNIYYVYKPITMCGEGQQIHGDAVRMVRVAVLLLQLTMSAFSFIRGGLNLMSCMTFLGAAVTICCFFLLSPFPTCKPLENVLITRQIGKIDEQYIAPVLIKSDNSIRQLRDHNNHLVASNTTITIENQPTTTNNTSVVTSSITYGSAANSVSNANINFI